MTFKGSKGAYAIHQPSTDGLKAYRGSPIVGTQMYISLEGDKKSHLPRCTHLDKQNPTVRSWFLIWQTNDASNKTNNISRTLSRAQQMAAKGDLSVNLCKRYVFEGWFRCSPMQYYERHAPISDPVYSL